MSSSETQ